MADPVILITDLGLAKIAAATANNPLQLEKFAVGDGDGAAITPDPSMTALVDEKYRDFLNSKYSDNNNLVIECVLRRDANITTGFTIRELGIFDVDGTMIAIASVPDAYRPPIDDSMTLEQIYNVVLSLSNTPSITINLQSGIFATQDALNREIQDRTDADTALDGKITDNTTTIQALQTQVNDLITTLNNYHDRRIGVEFYYSGNNPPEGALACDGSLVDITQYQKLFNVVGHKYNSNNNPGNGKFKLPDGRDRVLRGASATRAVGGYEEDQLKSHVHDNSFSGLSVNVPPLSLPNITGVVASYGDQGFDAFIGAYGAFALGDNEGWRADTIQKYVAGTSNSFSFDSHRAGATQTGGWNGITGSHSGNTGSTGGDETRVKGMFGLTCIWFE